jgi:hypothetical protein
MLILKAIKIVIISILAIFYYPITATLNFFQKHYRLWKREDTVSYVLATPLYYLLIIIATIISMPFEALGEGMHPPLDKFR